MKCRKHNTDLGSNCWKFREWRGRISLEGGKQNIEFLYCKDRASIESMTKLNQQLSSFYNSKEEFRQDEGKRIADRNNENIPTNSFENVKEGFHQEEEEGKHIAEEKRTNMQL